MQKRWKRGEFVAIDGLVLKGFDPVAYFTDGRARRGHADTEAEWSGVRWRFASEGHRDRFLADPESFAPRFGGRCGFAVSFSANPKAPPSPPGSPRLWTIRNGRLYLNQNPMAHLVFRLAHREKPAEQVWADLSE